ncbi:MAG TPA: helix-turn-helix domain-containing protein, partial [Sphingomicrobium sp.]
MPRHRHAEPYMAIVVEGGYLEAGDSGRIEARPGDVLIHGAYEAHQDAFMKRGATVLNLPLEWEARSAFGRIRDVDAIVRLAARDPLQASVQARAELERSEPALRDWPDLLATALHHDPDLSISAWAEGIGLAPASVSRGFARAYGVSPKRFRLEARARRAAQRLPSWQGGLASLAAELGFADQAHMSRVIAAMTGLT